jgi:hypothetical protein
MNGASDPEREQALEDYKRSLLDLREWEAKLKTLRMGIKDLQREFDISEENIKALQSVGQIIGEVLKQLDEERCTVIRERIRKLIQQLICKSHCQGFVRTQIRRRLPLESRQAEVEARHTCCSRYDDSHDHEDAAERGRSVGVQHVLGGPRTDQLCWYWWFE